MKVKAILLILLGVLGAIFICIFDIITGKPVNDLSGPKSISALVICGLLITAGIYFLLGKQKKQ